MLIKILVGLVLAAGLAYGGLKFYVAHQITNVADRMKAMLAPVATVKYHGTTSSLGGTVGVTGVTVNVRKTGDFFRIGAVKLKTDSLFTLMDMDDAMRKGDVPKTFGVEIDHMTIPVTARMLDQSHGNLGLLGSLHLPVGALHCGRRSGFSASDLDDMGIEHLTASVSSEIRREPAHNDIRFLTNAKVKGINSFHLDFSIAARHGSLKRLATTHKVRIAGLSLEYRDEGWHQRMLKFCTDRAGLSRKAWIAAHVAAVKTALARAGIGVGPDLLAAYGRFLKTGGRLTLAIKPQSPVDISALRLYSLSNAIAYLAPTLRVNGKLVKQLDVRRIKPVAAPATRNSAVAALPGQARQGRFRNIRIDTLGRHVGERVRLSTSTSRVFTGKLAAMRERVALVDVKSFGKTERELVLLSKITKAEVAVPGRARDSASR